VKPNLGNSIVVVASRKYRARALRSGSAKKRAGNRKWGGVPVIQLCSGTRGIGLTPWGAGGKGQDVNARDITFAYRRKKNGWFHHGEEENTSTHR